MTVFAGLSGGDGEARGNGGFAGTAFLRDEASVFIRPSLAGESAPS